MTKYQLFIDGGYVDPAAGEWLDSIDPYRGDVWAHIPRGRAEDAARAAEVAKRAMTEGPWATMSASQRGKLLRRIGDLLARDVRRLAEIEVRDNGKLLAEVCGQLEYAAECWHYYAGLADKIEGASVPIDKADMLAFTQREPVGVVAAVTAWNGPV